MQAEFERSNRGTTIQLDEYGFVGRARRSDTGAQPAISSEEKVVAATRAWLARNSRFTGVARAQDLVVTRTRQYARARGGPRGQASVLQIFFAAQRHAGLPVLVDGRESAMVVTAGENGVLDFDGHWFGALTLPLAPAVPEARARAGLLGRKFGYSDYRGGSQSHTASRADLKTPGDRVILVHRTTRGLEVRLAWRIEVGEGMSWKAFVDAIDGSFLEAHPDFVS